MPWIIGEDVQDYKIVLATIKDKICLIVIFPWFLAQDAAAFCGTLYIFHSPRCPKIFH